jgi:ribosome-binding protein aMBF1 (putative translation factor)
MIDVNRVAFFEARLEKFLSQETLASQAGVSPNVIKRIEKGQKIGSDVTRKVLAALGLTVGEAFERNFISMKDTSADCAPIVAVIQDESRSAVKRASREALAKY